MKHSDVFKILEDFAPVSLKEEWDNVGLMLGSLNDETTGIILALDLIDEVIDQAIEKGCNLIVTHHPFFFHAIKCVDFNEAKGRQIKRLIENGISVYSMHTNLDKAEKGLNFYLASKFGYNIKIEGCAASFDVFPTTLKDLAKKVSDELHDKSVKVVGNPESVIKRAFIVSGSGGSEYETARSEADVLITGDLKHHNYIDAVNDNFSVIEYSHFSSEIVMQEILESVLQGIEANIYKANISSPYRLMEELWN